MRAPAVADLLPDAATAITSRGAARLRDAARHPAATKQPMRLSNERDATRLFGAPWLADLSTRASPTDGLSRRRRRGADVDASSCSIPLSSLSFLKGALFDHAGIRPSRVSTMTRWACSTRPASCRARGKRGSPCRRRAGSRARSRRCADQRDRRPVARALDARPRRAERVRPHLGDPRAASRQAAPMSASKPRSRCREQRNRSGIGTDGRLPDAARAVRTLPRDDFRRPHLAVAPRAGRAALS